MGAYPFGVTGQERKNLVAAISEILGQPKKYLGTPSYGFSIGDYTVDRKGTLHGEYNMELLLGLTARGFIRTDVSLDEMREEETEMEENEGPEMEENAGPELEEAAEPEAETDTISITMPLDGFTPEALDNLCKMVIAKELLIEKALGVETVPIRVLENGIEFPWFTAEHANDMMAYAQFISALCATAKEKKCVTAKPQESFENERFTMRVFLIGLGLVGGQYSRIRQLLTKPLDGNGAWRYFQHEKAVEEAETAQGETPADETPSDEEGANVAEDNADTAEVEGEVLA